MTHPDGMVDALPENPEDGTRPLAWWGMVLFITTEAMLFAGLISSYFYLRYNADYWPLGGIREPELDLALIGTATLLGSSLVAHIAEKRIASGDLTGMRWSLGGTIALGLGFLSIQATEYLRADFSPQTNAYGSIFFGVTGFHGLHVLVGLAMLSAVLISTRRRARYSAERHLPLRLAVMYWHFVDIVWIFVFSSLYLSERL